jgi:hypothetical protein
MAHAVFPGSGIFLQLKGFAKRETENRKGGKGTRSAEEGRGRNLRIER